CGRRPRRGTGLMEAAKPSLTIAPRPSLIERLGMMRLDPIMLFAALGLIAFSIFTLDNATSHEVAGQPLYFVERQGLYALVGIALMLGLSRFDYTRLRDLRITLYGAMIAAIALVLVGGTAVRGSHRWIELPLFRFEPSELAKVVLCVTLAAFVFERVRRPFGLGSTLRLLALGVAPAALVFLQPDLGTGIVLVVIVIA